MTLTENKAFFIHKTDSLKINDFRLMKNAPKPAISQTLVKHQTYAASVNL